MRAKKIQNQSEKILYYYLDFDRLKKLQYPKTPHCHASTPGASISQPPTIETKMVFSGPAAIAGRRRLVPLPFGSVAHPITRPAPPDRPPGGSDAGEFSSAGHDSFE